MKAMGKFNYFFITSYNKNILFKHERYDKVSSQICVKKNGHTHRESLETFSDTILQRNPPN